MMPFTRCRRCGLEEWINPRPLNCPRCGELIAEEFRHRVFIQQAANAQREKRRGPSEVQFGGPLKFIPGIRKDRT